MPEALPNLETLQYDAELFVFRSMRAGEPLLVVEPAATEVGASIAQFENAVRLRGQLAPAWAARPRALEQHHGKPALLVDDPGGQLLSRQIRGPGELTVFLRIAVGAAAALRELHARGIVHRDVKPANLIVTPSGELRLFGFGIAARLPAEGSIRAPVGTAVGTLAYMAPEQTGAMDRGVDARSDLYALGVTLYELATGALPFAAADAREWIHAHLAKEPRPVEGVPAVVAAIIAKLLAKAPEDRYQSAAGVEADLRRCLFEWEAHGLIEQFPLGNSDLADRLRIREAVYGRETELEALRAAVDHAVAGATPQLILISGQPGIGKSALGRQLQAMAASRALFAAGKLQQYHLEVPYPAMAQALKMLVRDILARSEEVVAHWRAALKDAMGPNGQLIINLAPEMELIVGKQAPVPDLQPQEARNRFQSLFRSLLAVFAGREHPLVLFLDDLQWAGPGNIDLLVDFLTSQEVTNLLVVGAYREDGPGADSLTRAAEAIRSAGGLVKELRLSPLSISDVARLVSDALHSETARVGALAEVLHSKTAGNPFFTVQFLRSLADEGLLTFDRAANAWVWDLDRVREKGVTDNVVDLVTKRIDRLASATVEVLEQMACVGNVVEVETLAAVCGVSVPQLAELLADALTAGLVLHRTETYAFVHDRVHEAAYALVPEPERAAVHLRIGRLLWSRTAAREFDQKIFDIADQLARGASLIKEREEQVRVAELQLAAGRRARAATAYASALKYLAAARALLGNDAWEQHYSLTFAIERNIAECEFLTSAPAAEQRLTSLSSRAIGLVDLASVTSLCISLELMLNKGERALEIGIEYLRRVGFEWQIVPSEEEVIAEHDRMWSLLGPRPVEAIADLPSIKDVLWKGVMDVLCSMIHVAAHLSPRLHQLCLFRMANLSLEHGYCGPSCSAYAQLSLVLGPTFKNYEAGFRLCRTAFEIVERDRLLEWRAQVYLLLGYHVLPYTGHIQESLLLLRRTSDAARESGDLLFSTYNDSHIISTRLALGHSLADVEREANCFLARVRQMRFGLLIDCYAGQLSMISALRGQAPQYESFGQSDEASLEQHFAEDRTRAIAACWYWIRKLQALVFANNAEAAVEAARRARELLWTTSTYFEIVEYRFYAALAHAAAGDASAVAPHRAQLATWAERNPETFANRLAIVDAELARLEQRWFDAERAYEQAVELSRQYQFVHHEGLASELAARFYAGRGLHTAATAYLRNARSCYVRWGADGLVRALDHARPELHEFRLTKATATGDVPLGEIDLATVVQASQAVSGEIVLEKLLERLLTLAVEYAGAGRGLLISPIAGEMRIVAEAVARQRGAMVSLHQKPLSAAEAPESILNYVVRTRDSVILQDALQPSPFTADEYLRQAGVRSVLCLPLVKGTHLAAALYLENKLTSHVFSAERSEVLRLVASQAAISLENARLYAELQLAGLYLAEAQQLSHTGSFHWIPARSEIIWWSDETCEIFGYDRGTKPTLELVMARVHPKDRERLQQLIERVMPEGEDWQIEHREYRLLMPGGSIKHLRVVTRPAHSGGYIGAVMDVTAAKLAEKSAQDARAELERVTRATNLGELTGSIAHELNQPLAAVVSDAGASLRWLDKQPPDVERARAGLKRTIEQGVRAGEIIKRIRGLVAKSPSRKDRVDVNKTVEEVIELTRSEIQRHDISLVTRLSTELPLIWGDRIQLQQVILNLIINAMEATSGLTPAQLTVKSGKDDTNGVVVSVVDSGRGLQEANVDRLFEPFYTTKPNGMGMGLAICRSIITAHKGRLWATPNVPRGAVFQFTLPSDDRHNREL